MVTSEGSSPGQGSFLCLWLPALIPDGAGAGSRCWLATVSLSLWRWRDRPIFSSIFWDFFGSCRWPVFTSPPGDTRHEVLGWSIALTLFWDFCQSFKSSELDYPHLYPCPLRIRGRFFLCTALNTCTFSRPEFEDWQKKSQKRVKAILHPKTSCRLGVR